MYAFVYVIVKDLENSLKNNRTMEFIESNMLFLMMGKLRPRET